MTTVDIALAHRAADGRQKILGCAALGRHDLEAQPISEAVVARPQDQQCERVRAIVDEVYAALDAGEHLIVVQWDVDVFDRGIAWLDPLILLVLGQLREMDAHIVVRSADAVQLKYATLSREIIW